MHEQKGGRQETQKNGAKFYYFFVLVFKKSKGIFFELL
jgi:hypothetical protein